MKLKKSFPFKIMVFSSNLFQLMKEEVLSNSKKGDAIKNDKVHLRNIFKIKKKNKAQFKE